ncbi:hypothetical protein GFL72_30940 [Rhizobium leguminosarum bv. viciae]|nr:hypothetical protein [Rhizobium leguminosarum bv. viciae]
MPKTRAFGGGEGQEVSPERKIVEKFAFARQERAAVSGLQSRDRSAEPRRNLLERPENQAFPVIQGDRHC